jgi:hypothetical protein
MKKLLVLLAVMLMLTACESKSGKLSHYENRQPVVTPEVRIKRVYQEFGANGSYEIIEVDSHLYLNCYRGGIVHMESCPCKRTLLSTDK